MCATRPDHATVATPTTRFIASSVSYVVKQNQRPSVFSRELGWMARRGDPRGPSNAHVRVHVGDALVPRSAKWGRLVRRFWPVFGTLEYAAGTMDAGWPPNAGEHRGSMPSSPHNDPTAVQQLPRDLRNHEGSRRGCRARSRTGPACRLVSLLIGQRDCRRRVAGRAWSACSPAFGGHPASIVPAAYSSVPKTGQNRRTSRPHLALRGTRRHYVAQGAPYMYAYMR